MHPRWVRWTVIVLAVLLAATLALSAVPSDARPLGSTAAGTAAPVVRLPADAHADHQQVPAAR